MPDVNITLFGFQSIYLGLWQISDLLWQLSDFETPNKIAFSTPLKKAENQKVDWLSTCSNYWNNHGFVFSYFRRTQNSLPAYKANSFVQWKLAIKTRWFQV